MSEQKNPNEGVKAPIPADGFAMAKAFAAEADIIVSLTYSWAPFPIEFPCRLMLEESDISLRQKFYAQPEADQKAGQHAYNVAFLSSIIVDEPAGLPGFEAFVEKCGGDYEKALTDYLSDGTKPRIRKIASDAIDMYNRDTQPAEFFR